MWSFYAVKREQPHPCWQSQDTVWTRFVSWLEGEHLKRKAPNQSFLSNPVGVKYFQDFSTSLWTIMFRD